MVVGNRSVPFRNVSGQLKNLMDRTHFLHASYKLGGKVGGAIAVTGSTGAETTLAIINSFFLQYRMVVCHPGAFAVLRRLANVGEDELAPKGARDLGGALASLLKRLC